MVFLGVTYTSNSLAFAILGGQHLKAISFYRPLVLWNICAFEIYPSIIVVVRNSVSV
ncbi:hypothetical protein DAI22_07g096600 [Oryza sativa Japonica Group]|nr:hypothetical protein DAI22_07g096600 [Oryza sativa Japonica Group]